MKNPILSVKNLNLSFGNKVVLKNISFEVFKGEYIGLIGPNGAGKTSLLKCILGLIKYKSGAIKTPSNLSVGYVPQQIFPENYFSLSVKEILGMAMTRRSIFRSASESQCMREKLAAVGLEDSFLTQNFYHLSDGQKQRIVIARSLIQEPQLLLFDEPLSAVDYKTKILIHNLLESIRENLNISILFVSHEVERIVDKCHRILCLDKKLHNHCHPIDFSKGKKVSLPETPEGLVPVHHHHRRSA